MFRWKISIIIQIIVLSISLLPEDAPAIEDIGKWKRFEVSYINTTWSGNPFDLVLDGVFTHTGSGSTKIMPGFYAGNNTWKIFFMPDKLGEWTYSTQSADSDINNKTGSFNCVESGLSGQLIPVGNRWKLQNEGFVAPIMLRTLMFLREENGLTSFDEFLPYAKNTVGALIVGQNFGWDWPWSDGSGTGDVWTVEGDDFNIPMFDRMNERYDAIRDSGMGHYIMFYVDSDDNPNWNWGAKSEKELRYFRYMIARFSAYPIVIWDSGIDIGEFRSDAWINWFADYIKQIDPYDHPVSSRSGGGSGGLNPDSATYYSDGADDLPLHNSLVSDWNSLSIPLAYTDIWRETYGGVSQRGLFTPDKMRRAAWEVGLVGGTAIYVGRNKVDIGAPDTDPESFVAAPYLGYASNFFKNSIADLGALDPHDELITGTNAILSANPGQEYVAYLNTGGTVQIDLSSATGTLNVEWYNPRTGVLAGQSNIDGGGFRSFSAPDSNDWVLHIGRGGSGTSPDSTPSSSPQDFNVTAQSENQIYLAWQAAEDPESGIKKYRVFRDNVVIGEPTIISFLDTGLNEGTTYTYAVSAVNGAGLESEKSSQASVTTMADTTPPTMTSVSVNSDSTHVTLIFSEPVEKASAEDISNYNIDQGITVSGASLGDDLKTVTLTTSSHSSGVTYTLTVNNIKDRATLPNTIDANTEITYTYIDSIVISNLTVTSSNTYEAVQDGLQIGSHVYTDRGYTFTSIPSLIQGATYIKTANDDKSLTDLSFLSFNVNEDVTVFVAYDDRNTVPTWLSLFSDSGDNLETNDTTLSIFVKDFPSGTVVLGANEGTGGSMYSVIIQGASSIDILSPKPPTNLRKKE